MKNFLKFKILSLNEQNFKIDLAQETFKDGLAEYNKLNPKLTFNINPTYSWLNGEIECCNYNSENVTTILTETANACKILLEKSGKIDTNTPVSLTPLAKERHTGYFSDVLKCVFTNKKGEQESVVVKFRNECEISLEMMKDSLQAMGYDPDSIFEYNAGGICGRVEPFITLPTPWRFVSRFNENLGQVVNINDLLKTNEIQNQFIDFLKSQINFFRKYATDLHHENAALIFNTDTRKFGILLLDAEAIYPQIDILTTEKQPKEFTIDEFLKNSLFGCISQQYIAANNEIKTNDIPEMKIARLTKYDPPHLRPESLIPENQEFLNKKYSYELNLKISEYNKARCVLIATANFEILVNKPEEHPELLKNVAKTFLTKIEQLEKANMVELTLDEKKLLFRQTIETCLIGRYPRHEITADKKIIVTHYNKFFTPIAQETSDRINSTLDK